MLNVGIVLLGNSLISLLMNIKNYCLYDFDCPKVHNTN